MRDKIYFASDFHLGLDYKYSSKHREVLIVQWLRNISTDAKSVYLLGDIFDYWFEYRTVVPRGYIRLLSELSLMKEKGINIFIFTGNHDMWMFDYFEKELSIPVYREPQRLQIHGKNLLIGHGDGLGPGDNAYKIIKRVFSNKLCQWLFERIHPNTGLTLMKYISGRNDRMDQSEYILANPVEERLIQYCESHPDINNIDFFIFGHRHIAYDYTLSNEKSRCINTGDWLNHNSYAILEGGVLSLEYFK